MDIDGELAFARDGANIDELRFHLEMREHDGLPDHLPSSIVPHTAGTGTSADLLSPLKRVHGDDEQPTNLTRPPEARFGRRSGSEEASFLGRLVTI